MNGLSSDPRVVGEYTNAGRATVESSCAAVPGWSQMSAEQQAYVKDILVSAFIDGCLFTLKRITKINDAIRRGDR